MNKILKTVTLVSLFIVDPVAGAVATAATAISAHEQKKARHEEYQEGYQKAKAEDTIKISELKKRLKACAEKIKKSHSYEAYECLVIPLFAVAISAANSDGEISSCESKTIEDVVLGLSQNNMPEHVVRQISQFYMDPPNFKTAMEYVNKSSMEDYDAFDAVIDYVISADDIISDDERAYKEAWLRYKDSHINKQSSVAL